MTPATLRHVPFRLLGSTAVHLRYLEDDAELRPFLGLRSKNAEDLCKRAPVSAHRLLPAAALGQALRAYAERFQAPQAVLDGCAAVAEGASVVVTGQQPGLLGGPLYTVHKAATAIRLARELNAQPGAPKVVPLFWNHTDDHDLDECNRAFLVNANQDIARLRLEVNRQGAALRDIAIGRAMEAVLAAAGDLLPGSEFRDWALKLFAPQHPDEHLGDQLARMLFGMFGAHGLVVIEPRDLPPPAFDVLGRWWEQADAIQKVIRTAADDLLDIGLDTALDPGASLMFHQAGGRRTGLADGDLAGAVATLSPGALLRPLWQDACLPSIAFVVGPGELSYLAAVGPLYRHLGVPQPVLVPRASLTLVEPSLARLLHRFQWDLPDLKIGPEELKKSLPAEATDTVEDDLEAMIDDVRSRLTAIGARLRETDQQMLGQLERCRQKTVEELSRFATKLRNERQNRAGTGLRQIKRLCSNLRPRDRLQERVLPALPFLVAHGQALASQLVEAASPFMTSHGVLEL
jgi:uncharacterized protein YllA (UPF0747 family)